MGTVTTYTAARMAAIEANAIVSGSVVGDNLILTKYSGATVNAGNVRGATGATGAAPSITQDSWHTVGAAGEPAFGSGFGAYGSGFELPAFQKDPSGIVRLKGLYSANTAITAGAIIFTLPAGYRPALRRVYEINSLGPAFIRVDVYPTGDVVLLTSVTSGTLFSLEDITFDTGSGTWPVGATQPIPLVNALPSSPIDGQECYYQNTAMAAAGAMWRLRYRSGASGSYKWEFVGGGKLLAQASATNQSFTSSGTSLAWTQLPAAPTITIPLAGDYEVEGSFELSTTNALTVRADVRTGTGAGLGITQSDVGHQQPSAGGGVLGGYKQLGRFTGVSSGAVASAYVALVGTSQAGIAVSQFFGIRPVRVG